MFERKVDKDELQELEEKQKSDVASVLELQPDTPVLSELASIEAAPAEPTHIPAAHAQPAWVDNLALADHYTEKTIAEELVKHVHDLMADDVAALVHERLLQNAEDEHHEMTEGVIPDFFADSAQEIGTNDDKADDLFVVSSAHRPFIDDDDPWNGGGGGGGGGAPPGDDAPDAPPAGDPNPPKPTGSDPRTDAKNAKSARKPDRGAAAAKAEAPAPPPATKGDKRK